MSAALRHVALNGLWFDPGRSSGTETYLRGLVPALARERPDLRLTLATTRRGADALIEEGWGDFCALVRVPTDEGERVRRLLSELVRFPDLARRRGCDLLHSLSNTGPALTPAPHVVTIHDVIFFHHATMPWTTTLATRAVVGAAARRAAGVITVSETSRDAIVSTLPVAPERVSVVHNGAGREPGAGVPAEVLRERLDLPAAARVVLCVAALRPHKNQALLVRALARLPEDVVLVLAGHEEAYADDLRSLGAGLSVQDRLRFAGYVSDAELEGLYALAACAAFPTLAEGFGLPVLEALRRGLPVACSDLAVLHEVGGDACVYFDPHDDADATRAVLAAVERAGDAQAGMARAAGFGWAAAAKGTLAAYERALTLGSGA